MNISIHPVNVLTETTWPRVLKQQQMHSKDHKSSLISALGPLTPHNSSWQLCTANAAGVNKVISGTLKQRAKEFMNIPLPLLTVHRQMFQKAKTSKNRSFVPPQGCQLFAVPPFLKAAEGTSTPAGRFTVWMEPIHPSRTRVHPEGDQCQEYFTVHVV